MKDVKATQVIDGKMRTKQIVRFVGGKEVEANRNTAPIAKFDLTAVQTMVEFEISGPFDRIDEYSWRTAD